MVKEQFRILLGIGYRPVYICQSLSNSISQIVKFYADESKQKVISEDVRNPILECRV